MEKLIVISDFDNTISDKDFYWILLDDYIGPKGREFYNEWKPNNKIGTEFLNKVFTWYDLSYEEHIEAMDKVIIDHNLKDVVDYLRTVKGDFAVLSAGFDYYIHHVLKQHGLGELDVYTNKGIFDGIHFQMIPDQESPFYSPVYGIDKGKVVLEKKKDYETVVFIGDSEPDYWAAIHADIVFAKEELGAIMKENDRSYYPFSDFKEILLQLKQLGL